MEETIRQNELRVIVNAAIAAQRHVSFERYGKWFEWHCAGCALESLTNEVLCRRITALTTPEEQAAHRQEEVLAIIAGIPRPIKFNQTLEILNLEGVEWGDYPYTREQMEQHMKQHVPLVREGFDLMSELLLDIKNTFLGVGSTPVGQAGMSALAAALSQAFGGATVIPVTTGEVQTMRQAKKKGKGKKNAG